MALTEAVKAWARKLAEKPEQKCACGYVFPAVVFVGAGLTMSGQGKVLLACPHCLGEHTVAESSLEDAVDLAAAVAVDSDEKRVPHADVVALVDAMHVFRMIGGPDTVIAKDPEDAWAMWCEWTGSKREDYDKEVEWHQLPDDRMLKIITDDGAEEKTCAQWVAADGRSFLCSTEI